MRICMWVCIRGAPFVSLTALRQSTAVDMQQSVVVRTFQGTVDLHQQLQRAAATGTARRGGEGGSWVEILRLQQDRGERQ